MIRKIIKSQHEIYLLHWIVAFLLFSSIFIMFLVQFNVEKLQTRIAKTELEINSYQDKLQLLEVEWVYLTRPERLRNLSSIYLKENGYASASQIKDEDKVIKYYQANYQEKTDKEIRKNNTNL